MLQFGTGFDAADPQAVRNLKKQFLKTLKVALIVYPEANVVVEEPGFRVLAPDRGARKRAGVPTVVGVIIEPRLTLAER